jgi:2-polyprenyl-6-methoxyphenol hydroxylase-like FAD-dependent oxidoreductase
MDTDVIVTGGGPAGLMLANELGLAGVRTTVLERLPERVGLSKALNLQPRSAEILDLRGLLDPLLDQALDRIPTGHFAGLDTRSTTPRSTPGTRTRSASRRPASRPSSRSASRATASGSRAATPSPASPRTPSASPRRSPRTPGRTT